MGIRESMVDAMVRIVWWKGQGLAFDALAKQGVSGYLALLIEGCLWEGHICHET